MSRLDDAYADIAADEYWDGLRLPGINFVPGYGQRNKPVAMILGEAPGATENARLRPFCGPSGQVLAHLMEVAGLRLEDEPDGFGHAPDGQHGMLHDEHPDQWRANAFVTNVVKYRPPHNATPSLGMVYHAKESLRAEYRALGSPPVIICVGGTAFNAVHPMAGHWKVSDVRRMAWNKKHGHVPLDCGRALGGDGPWFLTSWHPAYGLRNGPKTQQVMTRDWETFGEFLQMEGIL